jgi:hypothetical protein
MYRRGGKTKDLDKSEEAWECTRRGGVIGANWMLTRLGRVFRGERRGGIVTYCYSYIHSQPELEAEPINIQLSCSYGIRSGEAKTLFQIA